MAAYGIAREVADEGDALVSISLSETTSYKQGKPKEVVQPEFEQQLKFFKDEGCDIDFIVCEVQLDLTYLYYIVYQAYKQGYSIMNQV